MVKISKDQARYVDHSTTHDECQDCRHFEVLASGHCEAVKGIIDPDGWCKLFSRKKSKMAEAFKGKKS